MVPVAGGPGVGGMLDEDEHGTSVGLFVDLSVCLSGQQLFYTYMYTDTVTLAHVA